MSGSRLVREVNDVKKLCLVGLVLFSFALLFGGASAGLQVGPDGGVFGPGEVVPLEIFVFNEHDELKEFLFSEYISSDNYTENASLESIILPVGNWQIVEREFTVSETMPSGIYEYHVSLYLDNTVVDADSASFEIAGTLERFEGMRLVSCRETSCTESTSATTGATDDSTDRSTKSSVDCRNDRRLYEGRKENYFTIRS